MDKINHLFSVNEYKKSTKISQKFYNLSKNTDSSEVEITKFSSKNNFGSSKFDITFSVKKPLKQSAISLIFEATDWTADNYVFAPSALYNGNRFKSVHRDYAPMYTDSDREFCKNGPVISDVPRLSLDGDGTVQLNTGDLATPCAGFFSKKDKKGYLWFWEQHNELGNYGITVSENTEKKTAQFILTSPCMRENYKYGMCTTDVKSDDRGRDLSIGDKISFSVTQHCFDCGSEIEFIKGFFDRRNSANLPHTLPNGVPFSHAYKLIENKYNERNWIDTPGFYKSSEAAASIYRQWQTGWVGGTMNTLPGLIIGNSESVEKSKKTLDFVFDYIQHDSGFLYGVYCNGKIYGDNYINAKSPNIVMSRKNGDALYFLAKQIMFLRKNGEEINKKWEDGVKMLADAFVNFYRKNNEFAQFIDLEKLEPFVTGTASAAITPGALALCSKLFNNVDYLEIAEKSAQKYYDNFVSKGFTNGGPGEILGCPDSESAFGMLESFIALHAYTKNEKWLEYAKDTAALCASWCVSYDYKYNKDSQFYIRKIATSGAVWASVQNKHAAPGICTLSGASLLRLYRATNDVRYLELCRDIAHNITQYLSTEENPLYMSYIWGGNPKPQKYFNNNLAKALLKLSKSSKTGASLVSSKFNKLFNETGRIGERCNLSDWEGTANVGEFPGGSCWCEVSAMLTYLEIPAAYIQPDTKTVFVIDHMNCSFENENAENPKLIIENPTDYDAIYRLLIENKSEQSEPLDELFMTKYKAVSVPAHKKITISTKEV